ncbi:Crp/Fnr family transcriptional regulator [Runella zeae]|uniref:Crp/Fnr family transcriptional regulator n=1 Tax=Runella zeae TaxID=94255 RepID=UPI0003FFD193|nr:Crp/Fnr family transcriptional regulator [Runella zeae]
MLPQLLLQELLKANVSSDSVRKLLEIIKFQEVKNQQLLVIPGEICDKIFFVLEGGFVCRYVDEANEVEKTINFYLDNLHPFMSCVDSFFSELPTRCELRAISGAKVLVLSKKDLQLLMSEDMALFRFYHSMVTKALQEENDLKLKLIAYTSEQLYQYLISQLPVVIQRVPSRFIAEFMGISPEWLSKLKHRK